MPFPKGNKYAVGNPNSGRPQVHDREKLAKELIEWAQLPDSINLNGFCCTRKPPIAPSKIILFRNESNVFREAYETAKAFLAERREKMLNAETLHVKAYDLNATVYDEFLKEEKRQQAAYEAKLKNESEANKPTNIIIQVPNDLASGSKLQA